MTVEKGGKFDCQPSEGSVCKSKSQGNLEPREYQPLSTHYL